MKSVWKSIICLAMISLMLVSLAACGGSSHSKAGSSKEDEVIAASKKLYSQIREYAGKDYKAFSALFRNTPEEKIRNEFEANWENWDKYDKKEFVVIYANENIYWVSVVHYIVAGQHPNTSVDSASFALILSYEGGSWKIDYGEKAVNTYDANDVYPKDLMNAFNSNQNAFIFDQNNFMFLNENAVYKNCAHAEVKYAWQDEYGNLYVALWLVNGTKQNVAFYGGKITLKNYDADLIARLDDNYEHILKANSSKIVTIAFPPEKVEMGTEKWGYVTSYYDYNCK